MTRTTGPGLFQPHTLALAIALGISAPAHAVNFNIGEIEGQFDSSLSIGASWSMRSPDRDLIGPNNGGQGQAQTGDDGRLNFKKGETFSKTVSYTHLETGDQQLAVQLAAVFVERQLQRQAQFQLRAGRQVGELRQVDPGTDARLGQARGVEQPAAQRCV